MRKERENVEICRVSLHRCKSVALIFALPSFCSASFKDTLLNDIRKAREKYQGEELAKELSRIKLRMDNTEVLTQDIVMNLLFSYRDIQVRTWPLFWKLLAVISFTF